jgi:hypothetical protein
VLGLVLVLVLALVLRLYTKGNSVGYCEDSCWNAMLRQRGCP